MEYSIEPRNSQFEHKSELPNATLTTIPILHITTTPIIIVTTIIFIMAIGITIRITITILTSITAFPIPIIRDTAPGLGNTRKAPSPLTRLTGLLTSRFN
ncbi:MAG: hypothetical protein ACJA0W_001720 [Candidatus Azotimanducaceae bacterium]|jgi:hypothetical protein